MDVLRLLTRSTNLSKKSAIQAHHTGLPSGGAPSHPHFLAESTGEGKRGTKRKRGGSHKEAIEDDLPDFFKSENAIAAEQIASDESDVETGATAIENSPRGPHTQLLSQDERRHLLRKHKLKVHLVRGAERKKSKVKKSAKGNKAQDSGPSASFHEMYPQAIQSFEELQSTRLSKRLLKNLQHQGYAVPTEIQMAALAVFLGKENGLDTKSSKSTPHVDIMTVAPTGSGKTLAFLIPVMNDLLARRTSGVISDSTGSAERHVKAIILAPTHELVDQIVNEARKLAEGTGLKATAMQKGARIYQDASDEGSEILIKSDIVASTPLLLANSLQPEEARPSPSLQQVTHLVLDEADVLLDPMFREQTMNVWDKCTIPSLRTSLWSATMGSSIEAFTTNRIYTRMSQAPKEIRNDHFLVRIIAGLKDSALPNVSHHLTYAATEQGKLLAMRQLLHPPTNTGQDEPVIRPPFLVFTQTIPRAVALHSELLYDIPVEAGGSSRIAVLHSDLSLSARSEVMARFRKGEIWVLITTDLLSRGVDFRGINGVVNYDIPNSGAAYVHRAGRTGRAGREGGVCFTLYAKEDIPYIKNIANVIATAEKLKGKKLGGDGSAIPKWLLDALPDLSKNTKKELKRRGVSARRTEKGGKVDGKVTMRISTKSGYERKLENRKRGAKMSAKAGQQGDQTTNDRDDNDSMSDGFGGFED